MIEEAAGTLAMTRLSRIPFFTLLALAAITAGVALPFGPAVWAVTTSMPAEEEEKNPSEPTAELKLTHATPRPDAGAAPRATERAFRRPTPTRTLSALPVPFSPAVALNNGLSSLYRC
jgi:hypothetical protein